MRRVMVVGCSGSGKTTLARALAARLGAEHVELDSMFHQPGWTPLPREVFRERLEPRLRAERWVVDGNYDDTVGDLVIGRADTVVWLDLSRVRVMRQVVARTLRRVVRRVELWNGNRERWANLFDPRPEENIILWAFTRHPRYRARYEQKSTDPAFAHLTWHRLRTRRDVEELLASAEPPRE